MTEELVECRLCGKRWRSLGHHLRGAHGMAADEYRDRFGIRRGAPLTSPATRARFQERIREVIDAGGLDAHYAGNRERVQLASIESIAVKRQLRERGIELPHGTPPTPREVLEAIVVAIEAGAKVATAVKASTIGGTAFHEGLKRYPDLQSRIDALRPARGKLRAGLKR